MHFQMSSAICFNLDQSKISSSGITEWHLHNNFHGSIFKYGNLPNEKNLDGFKLKAFADDKIKVLQMMNYVFDRTRNIV